MKKFNAQEYRNSPLFGSQVDRDWKASPDKLYDAKDPNFAILHEKPEHRIVVFLKAQGKSNIEIYRILGGTFNVLGKPNNDGQFTQPWISQILRQPWARERIIAEIRKAGGDAIQEILKSSVEDSVHTLIELRDTAEESSTRRGAANDILDRYFGKPTQMVRTEATVKHIATDIAEVDRELEETQKEIARLTGASTVGTATSTASEVSNHPHEDAEKETTHAV